MRVAIITENFLPKLDGVTRTLARLLEHLQQQGHRALLLGPESGMEHYAEAEIVGTAGLPLPFYPELKFNFFRPLFIRRLKEFRPDIVHLVDPVVLGAAGLAAARFLNLPIISSYHTNLAAYCGHFGFSAFTRPMWSYNRFIHNQCVLTFCPSPSTAAMLSRQGFEHVRLWPRGVDTDLFQPSRRSLELRSSWLKNRADDTAILLYAGRLSWEKNLRLLIQAYRGMDTTRSHLVIVGDGPAMQDAQQDLAGLPVTFTGYLSGEQLATAYASADIFAFPSTSETFGQVVLEAMASALPVVGVHSEGVCDLVRHQQTGLLLNTTAETREQAEHYRALLTTLIEQASTRHIMGQAGLLEARQRSWPAAMQHLLSGYNEVIEAASPLVAA
ncbi:MAG TPA: glycosyltransferase family 1 protein [Ktedonobacteraceae bacterium]|nr:glycosyltransferase family 1 protein [Ktedonobacteraceae bacterium]